MKELVDTIWTWSLDSFSEQPIPKTAAERERAAKVSVAKSMHCRFCNKRYIYGNSLKKHEYTECTKRTTIPVDEVFTVKHCKNCNRGYTTTARLNAHLSTCVISEPEFDQQVIEEDGVFNYALRLVNEGLLSMAFRDFIRYGNGRMCVKFYKWILPLSRIHSNKAKYATEALYLYTSVNYLLSPRKAHLTTWNRFCNTSGRGRNIPCDRRLEHLNRLAKELMKACGHQNLTEELGAAIGSCIRPIHDFNKQFDKVSNIPVNKTYIDRDYVNTEDENTMLNILTKANVFSEIPGRNHDNFKGINKNPFQDLDVDLLRAYVMNWGHEYSIFQKSIYSRMYPTQ